MLLNRIDANVPMSAYIRMEDSSQEPDLRRVKRVGEGDLQVEVEDATLIGTAYWSRDRGLPVVIGRIQRLSLYTLEKIRDEFTL